MLDLANVHQALGIAGLRPDVLVHTKLVSAWTWVPGLPFFALCHLPLIITLTYGVKDLRCFLIFSLDQKTISQCLLYVQNEILNLF